MLGYVEHRHIHKTIYPNGSKIEDTIKYLSLDGGVEYYQFSVDTYVNF